jgi:hypothetical protein
VPFTTCLRGLRGIDGVLRERVRQLVHRELARQLAAHGQPVGGGDEDELHGAGRPRQLQRHRVRVQPVGASVAVHAERRHHGHDAVREQRLHELAVHPLDPARELVVDALQDPQGVRDHRVGGGAPQVGRGQRLQDLVGQPVGRGQRELQRLGIGDA